MQLLVYLLFFPLLFLISILPFRLFYLFSDVVYVIVYYIIGYRKSTVLGNLKLSFPEKSEAELKSISKKFYKHMCDMFLEMVKSLTISDTQLQKRFVFKNTDELKRLEKQGKSVLVMFGHYASYEWSVVVVNHINFKGYGIYKPLKNKYFDNLVRRIRSRYNTTMIPAKQAISKITQSEQQNVKSMTAFLSDQSPKRKKNHYWTDFMNIKTPVFTGAENLAKKLDLAVSYLKINKVKRGYYEAEYVSIADNANDFEDYKITDKFFSLLEAQIKAAPEYYLWTHKRWKHKHLAPKD